MIVVDEVIKSSLQALDEQGVLGAKEALARLESGDAKHAYDCAVILNAVNPPNASPKFDALLREVNQPGMSRLGTIHLLLKIHVSTPNVGAAAREIQAQTALGAVTADWKKSAVARAFEYSAITSCVVACLYLLSIAAKTLDGMIPEAARNTLFHALFTIAINITTTVLFHALAALIALTVALAIACLGRAAFVVVAPEAEILGLIAAGAYMLVAGSVATGYLDKPMLMLALSAGAAWGHPPPGPPKATRGS